MTFDWPFGTQEYFPSPATSYVEEIKQDQAFFHLSMDGSHLLYDLAHFNESSSIFALAKKVQNNDQLKNKIHQVRPSISGWCTQEKAEAFIDLVVELRPDVCVEIGTFGGASLFPVAMALKENGKGVIYGIDSWDSKVAQAGLDEVNRSWWSNVNFDSIRKNFNRLIDKHALTPYVVSLFMPAEKAAFFIPDIDVLFLDGNPSGDMLMGYINQYFPKVKVGGYIWCNAFYWRMDGKRTTLDPIQTLLESCEVVQTVDGGNCVLLKKLSGELSSLSDLELVNAHMKESNTPLFMHAHKMEQSLCSSGLRGVDALYVINLDERQEKWSLLQASLESFDLHANRVRGINGWQLPWSIRKELFGPYSVKLTGGEIGCFLSHLSILQDAYERGLNRIWVMEDDADIVDAPKLISDLLAELDAYDPNWDIFYTDDDYLCRDGSYLISNWIDPRPDQKVLSEKSYEERFSITDRINRTFSRFGCYSMILSKQGIKKIKEYYDHVYLWSPIDMDLHLIPEIRQYSSKSAIVTTSRTSPISDTKIASELNEFL